MAETLVVVEDAETKARLTPVACEPTSQQVQVGVVKVSVEEMAVKATKVVKADSVRGYE